MDIFIIINEEFNKSYFNFLTSWFIAKVFILFLLNNINISVRNDRFFNNLFDFILNFKSSRKSIDILFTVSDVISCVRLCSNLIFMYIHSAFSQATSLSNTNLMAHSHVLNTFNILDQDLFLLQSVDREWHSKRNRKWKTFWNSYDQDNNSNDTNLSAFH